MITAAAIAGTFAQESLEVYVPESQFDKGYFAGLKEGIMLPIEEHALRVTECSKPRMPRALRSEIVQKATSFWPMAKMMITQYNKGVEPAFLSAVEEAVERLVILLSMAVTYDSTAYCFGAIYSYEMKALLLEVWE